MSGLSTDAITRLAKLLGMLGSDHMGERAAAALKCTELLRNNGMTWADLIGQLNRPAPRAWAYSPPPPPPPSPWRTAAQACLDKHEETEFGPCLSIWENQFITDILSRNFPLSDKQQAVLDRIIQKMGVKA